MTEPAAALANQLPPWAVLVRAPNPGPMTLDGTNTWVLRVSGQEHAVVVDPGPLDDGHLRAVAGHGPVSFILITHGHPDHTEGARRLSDLLGGVPVLAAAAEHCVGAEPLGPDESMAAFGLEIRALATPGHTADSISFLVEAGGEHAALLSGDTILGRGTTVVAWPDGDLASYLSSLRRLAALGSVPVLPGHGPALADCGSVARYYLAHRQARLDQVRAVVADGARTPAEVVAAVYRDIDRALWPAAEWSVRAQLDYLAGKANEAAGTAEGGFRSGADTAEDRESPSGPVGLDTP